jgi:hypothetical protein
MITTEELILQLGVGTDGAVCVQRLLDQIPAYQVRRDAAGNVIAGHVVPAHEVVDATGHVKLVPAVFVPDHHVPEHDAHDTGVRHPKAEAEHEAHLKAEAEKKDDDDDKDEKAPHTPYRNPKR